MNAEATEVKARARFRVLKDLGVLLSGPDDPRLDPAGPEVPAVRHVFSAHTPLWSYEQSFYARPVPGAPPVFATLDPAISLDAVLTRTRFICLIGAEFSPVVERLLDEQGVLLLLFEHDPRRLARFLAQVDPARLVNKALVFLGRPHEFYPPLSALLGDGGFRLGFPVFYAPEGAQAQDAAYAAEIIEYVETVYYRERIYPLGSQARSRGIPFRDIVSELFYDQLVHVYQNLPAYANSPDIEALSGLFQGETAIVAAAGAALAEQYDFLRKNQDRAVIIAVNSALKPLVAAGIKPHFCVVNDNSLQVAKTFEGLPALRPVMLVGHCLSNLGGQAAQGGDVFPQKFLFSELRPDVFGPRPTLRLHGSVLTTGFSLARHMGCARVVLAGALLSSNDPWSLSYVTGKTGLGYAPESRELTNAWPQLYPVTNRFGRQRYTSLNFLDVKHWLCEEIRLSGIPVVNTSKDSIIDLPPVEFDEAPVIEPTGRLAQALKQAHAARKHTPLWGQAVAFAQVQTALHSAYLRLLDGLEHLPPEAFLEQGRKALDVLDQNNMTYLVQRYEDFDHAQFYVMITSPDPVEYARGLRYIFAYTRRMLGGLLEQLAAQVVRLGELAAQTGK
ncbi:MAG TPA: 6-hydroxymethylpterin diphosphokinase MptE-like protein [Humidesulfovibrio sp.]|uniref:6-hydroxymethylpterin diphosphokinase MptE-like protein n=1 Tax=Humidesulfovibrio sp. TaxID=2910988 RepID=UPI002C95E123|nr:6-hydroxymethylpterin diphosphokinase MptE-like protein [Humidesulfovibrio sp.]HWR02808.1 6-hydroxymethylpterin diphosphokinase MptE-like protein [Humidesulfovibrio sp.]